MYDALKEYKRLLEEGILTEEEFEKKKRELLNLPDLKAEERKHQEQKQKEEEERQKAAKIAEQQAIERQRQFEEAKLAEQAQQRKLEEAKLAEQARKRELEEAKLAEQEHLRKLEEERLVEREHQRKMEEAKLAEQERQRKIEEEKHAEAERKKQAKEIKKAERKAANRKRGKAIIIAIIAIAVLAGGILIFNSLRYSGRIDTTNYNATYEWPASGLATDVPKPAIETGEIQNNNGTYLDFYIYKAKLDDYNTYVTACKEYGFTVIEEESGDYYEAYNEAGDRYLEINYYEDYNKIYVVVKAPENWSEIYWPKSELAATLPVPSKLYGEVSWDDSDNLDVYIAGVTAAEFNAYIDACIAAGYNVDYSRYDDSFHAEDANGNTLYIYYQEFNVMNIDANAK